MNIGHGQTLMGRRYMKRLWLEGVAFTFGAKVGMLMARVLRIR
jgi:hypothetical protein